MTEPIIALVFSPEPWVERLHRHCADHGGAQVRHVIIDPRVALEESYDTLVVSHRWTALTPALVNALHDRARRVLGVFDLGEPAGHEHLVRLGADALVAADAPMAAFLDTIVELGSSLPSEPRRTDDRSRPEQGLGRLVAVCSTSGAGATELAIELTRGVARSGQAAVLVDVDESAPAVVTRLGLPLEPNLRTAIDGSVYGGAPVALARIDDAKGGFHVLGGMPSPASWAQVRSEEALLVMEQLAGMHDIVVADVGSGLEALGEPGRDQCATSRAMVERATVVVEVVSPTPVGVVRASRLAGELRLIGDELVPHLVVNRAPRDSFRRTELAAELDHSLEAASLEFVPEDRRVTDAAWVSELVAAGPFTKAIEKVASRASSPPRRRSVAVGRR